MPLPAGLTDLLKTGHAESHSTVQIALADADAPVPQDYRLATGALRTPQDGDFTDGLNSAGEIKAGLDASTDTAEVALDDVACRWTPLLVNRIETLQGAKAIVGRYWRDLHSGQEYHGKLMTGVVTGAKSDDQTMRCTIISDVYAARSVGANKPITKKCPLPFKGPGCDYVGPHTTCSHRLIDPAGCSGRSWTHRYGGEAALDEAQTITNNGALAPPANYTRVIDSAGNTMMMRKALKVIGGTLTDNPTTKETELDLTGMGDLGWIFAASYPGIDATGATDSAVGLQNLFNDAAIQGQRIYFKPGLYLCSTDIDLTQVLDQDGTFIVEGSGDTHTILRFTGIGHGFVGSTQRCDEFVFRDIRITSNNVSNTGDAFNFTAVGGVQTRILIERCSIFNWGGWGFYGINTQSSTIRDCHFRGQKKGHIAFIDDNVSTGTSEPNANTIANNLLDNPTKDAANVAVIKIYNGLGTQIIGNTIQGWWVGATGGSPATKPAIHVEFANQVRLAGNWFEGLNNSGAAVYLKDNRNTLLENNRYSGLNAKDVEIVNCRNVTFLADNAQNAIPHIVPDSSSREISVYGGYWSSPTNLLGSDSTPDGIRVRGVTYHNQNAFSSLFHVSDWQRSHCQRGINYFANGSFNIGITNWTGAATGLTRVATGGPMNGPYILCDTQALGSGGAVGGTNFRQTFSVPNAFVSGCWTLAFDFYVENFGTPADVLRWVDVEFAGSGFSGQAWRIHSSSPAYTSGKWYTATITDKLNTGTGRDIYVNINPTQGPSTPKVRFANFRLFQGVDVLRDGGVAGTDRDNTFWGANTFRQDLSVDATGSDTTTPRTIGISNMGALTAARLQFGDPFNSIQNSNGGKQIWQSYWGLKIRGNRQSGTLAGFEAGGGTDPNVEIVSDDADVTPLQLDSSVALAAGVRLQRWKENTNTRLELTQDGVFLSSAPAPSTTTGTGLGTTGVPTFTLDGTAMAGAILIHTGSNPAANAKICDVTLPEAMTSYPVVVLTPANAAAAALTGTQVPFVSDPDMTPSKWTFKSGAAALASSTDYAWYFHVIGI